MVTQYKILHGKQRTHRAEEVDASAVAGGGLLGWLLGNSALEWASGMKGHQWLIINLFSITQ